MEIKRISYENPLDRYYFQGFYDNLLSKNVDDDKRPDFDAFFASIANPTGRNVWTCIVAVENANVVAGISMDYLPKTACAAIDFVSALDGYEGTLDELIRRGLHTLREDNHTLLHIFTELTDEEMEMQEWKCRCKRVDMNYKAPALREDSNAVDDYSLLVVDDPATSLPGSIIKEFLEEYFINCYPKTDSVEECIPRFGRGAIVALKPL